MSESRAAFFLIAMRDGQSGRAWRCDSRVCVDDLELFHAAYPALICFAPLVFPTWFRRQVGILVMWREVAARHFDCQSR